MLVCRVSTDHLPYYSNSLKQSDVQEADGGGVIVHQVEKVDPALEVNFFFFFNYQIIIHFK